MDRRAGITPALSLQMPIVQFAPLSSLVQPSFWHELTNLKIDVLRLSDEILPVSGSYTVGRSIKDRETGQEIALGCNLTIGAESLEKDTQYVVNTFWMSKSIADAWFYPL